MSKRVGLCTSGLFLESPEFTSTGNIWFNPFLSFMERIQKQLVADVRVILDHLIAERSARIQTSLEGRRGHAVFHSEKQVVARKGSSETEARMRYVSLSPMNHGSLNPLQEEASYLLDYTNTRRMILCSTGSATHRT